MTLLGILRNYENKLCNKKFCYELNGKDKVHLVFYTENFCHLLGLHYVYHKDRRYLGARGYDLVSREKVTIESMKKHNEKGYNYIKLKIDNFNNIYDILTNGKITKFDVTKTFGDSLISANLVVYYKNKELLLHLFLRKEQEHTSQYTAISFIVKSEKEKNYNQYVARQKHMSVTNFEIVDIRSQIEK